MNIDNEEIYKKVYDIVADNMVAAGENLKFQRETFVASAGEYNNTVDLARTREVDVNSFLEITYIQLLNRFPEPAARNNWNNRIGKTEEIKKLILTSVLTSKEFQLKDSYLINNIYDVIMLTPLDNKPNIRMRLMIVAVKAGRKLPDRIKPIIKRIFHYE